MATILNRQPYHKTDKNVSRGTILLPRAIHLQQKLIVGFKQRDILSLKG